MQFLFNAVGQDARDDGGYSGKLRRWLNNTAEENQILNDLFFAEDSPLTVEGLFYKGNYKVGGDLTADGYMKYSRSHGIYSISGNIDKDGRLFALSVSVGASVKVSGVEVGVKLDVGRMPTYVARHFQNFVTTNSGLTGNVARSIQSRQSVLDAATL